MQLTLDALSNPKKQLINYCKKRLLNPTTQPPKSLVKIGYTDAKGYLKEKGLDAIIEYCYENKIKKWDDFIKHISK